MVCFYIKHTIQTSPKYKNECIKVTFLFIFTDPPSKPKLTMKSKVRECEVSIITCTVQSFPKSILTVTGPSDLRNMPKHRMNITQSENMLTISLNVTKSDAGVYNCTAINQEGTNQSEKELKVKYSSDNR